MTGTFFIPRPTKYVADWPGLVNGRQGKLGGECDSNRLNGGVSSTHLPPSNREVSPEIQVNLTILIMVDWIPLRIFCVMLIKDITSF